MYSLEEQARAAKSLRKDCDDAELARLREAMGQGAYHLRLAIEAFDSTDQGTDIEDLQDFLLEAVEVNAIIRMAQRL